jgi:carbon storage regulator
MLVLTRKYQEKIRIGHNITITVLRTKGKAVRLGIEAPADVSVIRGELAFDKSKRASKLEADAEGDAEPKISSETRSHSIRATDPSWGAESGSGASNRPFGTAQVRVELQRVPRDKVAEILPAMVAGSRPLRAMMNQR